MPATVIMPALELAQETGKVLRWLKPAGATVAKGEPIVEIETDKVTVEVEAPAAGVLGDLQAEEGDVVPVGQPIALIFAPGEARPTLSPLGRGQGEGRSHEHAGRTGEMAQPPLTPTLSPEGRGGKVKASPLARRIAEQHGVDLAQVPTSTGKIDKADVLAYVESRGAGARTNGARLPAASPKARRLAAERGLDVASLAGSGPSGAVLIADVEAAIQAAVARPRMAPAQDERKAAADGEVGTVWRIMAERMTQSWTSAPHFYLVREVQVARLTAWRERASAQSGPRITYTDLLVKLVAAALVRHPAANASWRDGAILRNADVNVGLAVAVDAGLVVPVLHGADALGLAEIAARREDVVARAQAGKLRPADIQGGGFTISNLGMYGIDAFNAIVNPPQAGILAVGRIADRVVAVDGQPAVRPTMVLTLSCDHRALDGARAAQFLGSLAELIEEPLGLLV
jgi:pyruvate dehydrogenase E2 component (dihydrolipoyllysine-residue acetyltransferase)